MAGTWDGIQTTYRDNVINITAVTLSSMWRQRVEKYVWATC